jgi:hypothetical protein
MPDIHERCDKACEVLVATHDGEDLDPNDLAMVEAHVNGWLTEKGIDKFEELYEQVKNGKYVKPWLCGVEHLTRDLQGYVYWKGINVEHYSFRDYDKMKAAAEELGRRCRIVESRGLEVTGKRVIWDWDTEKPEGGYAQCQDALTT